MFLRSVGSNVPDSTTSHPTILQWRENLSSHLHELLLVSILFRVCQTLGRLFPHYSCYATDATERSIYKRKMKTKINATFLRGQPLGVWKQKLILPLIRKRLVMVVMRIGSAGFVLHLKTIVVPEIIGYQGWPFRWPPGVTSLQLLFCYSSVTGSRNKQLNRFLRCSHINPLKSNGYYMYHLLFNTPKSCILPTHCICVFRMVLTINSDCFPKQH
jgi:hypothetical protein